MGTPPNSPGLATAPDLALDARSVTKVFGASRALDHVDIGVRRGEVHALVGQNGSGKSTFVKILAGFHRPDGGEATFHGKPLSLGDSEAAASAGIRFVHQDLGLVDDLSVVENVALGVGFDTKMGRISWRSETANADRAIRELGYRFDVRGVVGDLTPSERVGVGIARALRGWEQERGNGLLVLDEPTASMPADEVRRLFEVVRGVRDSGTSVIYVSHRFEEVFALADSVTVLRDGKVVTTRPMEGLDHDGLVELLLGRRLSQEIREHQPHKVAESAPVLATDGLGHGAIEELDLELHAGEVVGIAGVTGSGRETVAQLLFGAISPERGRILIDGEAVSMDGPADAVRRGIGLVPPERRQLASIPSGVRENLTLVDLKPFWRRGRLRPKAERVEVQTWIDRFSISPPDSEAPIESLSGGNQQKVLVAKWLRIKPRVLILDEPTQGVDVGSKADIHDHLRDAASAGMAVAVCSTDLEELVAVCDRVVVIVNGRVSNELSGGGLDADVLAEEILASAPRTGVSA